MFQSLPRLNLNDRRVQLAVGAFVLLAACAAFVQAIAAGNLQLLMRLSLLIACPALIVLAYRKPLFPYLLYVVAVPFDNLLLVSGVGTITKMLGFAAIASMVTRILRDKRITRPSYPLYCFSAYLIFNILSVLWTRDVPGGLTDVQVLVSTIALYGLLAVFPINERDLRTICSCIVISGVVASMFGIYVLHNVVNAIGDNGRLMVDVGDRTVDPNHYANSLLAPLALALVALANARSPARLIAAFGAVLILSAGIEISLSREALIAGFVMALVLAAFSRRRYLSFALLTSASLVVPLAFPAIGIRMMEAFSTGGAGRTSIWHIQWRSFLEHPVLGWGIGSAGLAYNRNFLAVYQPHSAGWNMASHNTALHILVDFGIVGLVLASLGILASFYELRAIRRGDSLYPLRAGLSAALCGVVIVSFFIDLATYKYLWLVLTTTVQFGSVARGRAVDSAIASPKVDMRSRSRSRASMARGVVLTGAFLAFTLPCAILLQWFSRRDDVAPPTMFTSGVVRDVAHSLPIRPDATASAVWTFHEVDDSAGLGQGRFSYSNGWEHLQGLHDGRSRGTSSRTVHAGATAMLRFDGRGLRIYGVKGAGGGRAQLLVDGATFGILRFYAPHKEPGVLIFQTLALRPGPHVALIVALPPSLITFKRGFVNLDGAAYAR